METLSKIIDLLNDKYSLPLAILCCILLFAPQWILSRLSLKEFVDSADTLISLIFLFSTVLYVYGRGKRFAQYIKSKLDSRTKRKVWKRTIHAYIKGLTPDEETWIYFCLRENVRTLYATEINGTAVSLESKTLIYRPKSVYDKRSTPFSFYPEVWKYLTRKKEKYCPRDKKEDQQYNERVNQFIKNLRNEG